MLAALSLPSLPRCASTTCPDVRAGSTQMCATSPPMRVHARAAQVMCVPLPSRCAHLLSPAIACPAPPAVPAPPRCAGLGCGAELAEEARSKPQARHAAGPAASPRSSKAGTEVFFCSG